jgi:hypothetical protein
MSAFMISAAAATAAIVLLAPAAARSEPVVRSFTVEPGGRLTVETETGSIDVATHDAGEVLVEVEIEGPGADRFEVDFRQRGGDVEVEGDARDGILGNRRSHVDVRYRIRVPGRYDVDLSTAGGSISVADLDGDARADTSGGTIELARISGQVDASTSGGGISVEYAGGDVSADTSGGSIRVEEAAGRVHADTSGGSIRIGSAAGPVDADTSGGSITVRSARAAVSASTSGGSIKVGFAEQPDARSRLSTSGGMVTVYLAQGVGFDVRARSGVGVSSDLDVEAERIEPGRLEGRVNGGGPRLELKSTGRVRIEPM